jgi:hypothetical protein
MRGRNAIADQRRIRCFTVSGNSQTMTAAASERNERDEGKYEGLVRIFGEQA